MPVLPKYAPRAAAPPVTLTPYLSSHLLTPPNSTELTRMNPSSLSLSLSLSIYLSLSLSLSPSLSLSLPSSSISCKNEIKITNKLKGKKNRNTHLIVKPRFLTLSRNFYQKLHATLKLRQIPPQQTLFTSTSRTKQ